MPHSAPRLRKLDHISLRVRDLEQSSAFYRDVLGLLIRPAVPVSLNARRCVSPSDAGRPAFHLELRAGRPVDAVPTLDHFGIEVPTVEALERVRAAAVEFGARTTETRREQGCRRLYVFDPDGHKIEVLMRGSQAASGAAILPAPEPLSEAAAATLPGAGARTSSLGKRGRSLRLLRPLDGEAATAGEEPADGP